MSDVSSGDWLLERVGDWAQVGGAAGTGFEAYARILHPVPAHRGEEQARWPWSEVAERVGGTMHPLVQWNRFADLHQGLDFADGWSVGQTREGFLELDLLSVLVGHLSAATSTPGDLVAGFWEGSGELDGGSRPYMAAGSGFLGWVSRASHGRFGGPRASGDGDQRSGPTPELRTALARGPFLAWPEREMLLFATSAAELADPRWVEDPGFGVAPGTDELSPQLIWPRGREWVVASEIDWDSTIVAGSRALVDGVLADDRLEAYEVHEDSDLTWEGDVVNPPRDGWPEEF